MVATKVLISLCVYGFVGGAPQLPAAPNGDGIINNVVNALQPQIAAAVAAALRGLSSSTTTTSTVAASNSGPPASTFNSQVGSSTGFESSSGFGSSAGFGSSTGSGSSASLGSSTGFGSSSGFGTSTNSGSAAGFGSSSRVGSASPSSGFSSAAISSGGIPVEEVTARAAYAYEYKVADEDEQTYISHEESRDGDDVTGSYSYIDPNGDLITVTYQAGAMGYTQTIDRKVGQVQIRSKGAEQRTTSSVVSGSNNAGGASGFSVGGVAPPRPQVAARPQPQVFVQPQPQVVVQPQPQVFIQPQVAVQPQIAPANQQVVRESATVTNTGSSSGASSGISSGISSGFSSGLDQSALIAQILSVLQPQINQAVSSIISGGQ